MTPQQSGCGFLGIQQSRRRFDNQKYFVSSSALLTGTITHKLNTRQSESELESLLRSPLNQSPNTIGERALTLKLHLATSQDTRCYSRNISKRRQLYSMPEKPQSLCCGAILVFSCRLVILSKDRILSNYQKKGFCGNSRKFSCAGHLARAFEIINR